MLFFRARYSSPAIGRFLNEDPIRWAGGINWYTYVYSDPINFIDPKGLNACSQFIEHLILIAEANMGWYLGSDMVQRNLTGAEIANTYVRSGQEQFILGNTFAEGARSLKTGDHSGFKDELTMDGQGSGVYYHVAAAAAATLEEKEFLVDLSNLRDAHQYQMKHRAQRLAEIAGNEAGRELGKQLSKFINEGQSKNDLFKKIFPLLCKCK